MYSQRYLLRKRPRVVLVRDSKGEVIGGDPHYFIRELPWLVVSTNKLISMLLQGDVEESLFSRIFKDYSNRVFEIEYNLLDVLNYNVYFKKYASIIKTALETTIGTILKVEKQRSRLSEKVLNSIMEYANRELCITASLLLLVLSKVEYNLKEISERIKSVEEQLKEVVLLININSTMAIYYRRMEDQLARELEALQSDNELLSSVYEELLLMKYPLIPLVEELKKIKLEEELLRARHVIGEIEESKYDEEMKKVTENIKIGMKRIEEHIDKNMDKMGELEVMLLELREAGILTEENFALLRGITTKSKKYLQGIRNLLKSV